MNESNEQHFQAVAAIDFSALGDRTVTEALQICSTHEQAELHVIVVGSQEEDSVRLPGGGDRVLPVEEANEVARNHVADLVATYQEAKGALNMEKVAVYVATGNPAERIVALAAEVDSDLIVMGTHGRTGLKRWVLGSVAEEVVRRAPCGVLVIRPRDFLAGEKVPDVQPPLREGEHALKPFRHRPTYHYVARNQRKPNSMMPAT